MNLAQWEQLHQKCAPQLKANVNLVSKWLSTTHADEVMELIATMKRAQSDKDAFQEYCDWLVTEVGGYTWSR